MFAVIDEKHRQVQRLVARRSHSQGELLVEISDELYSQFVDNPFNLHEYVQLPDGTIGLRPKPVVSECAITPGETEHADVVFYITDTGIKPKVNAPHFPQDEAFVLTLLDEGNPNKPVLSHKTVKPWADLMFKKGLFSLMVQPKSMRAYSLQVDNPFINFTYGVHYGPCSTDR